MISHKPAWSFALLAFVSFACNKGNDESDTGPLVCSDEDTFDTDQCPTSYPNLECTVYVDGDVESSGDGWSWDSPVKTVQEGVDLAHCGAVVEGVCEQWEVWVKEGTYYIHQGCREHTVRLREKVALLGGFDGKETAEWERDWEENETILNGRNVSDEESRVYHVLVGSDTSTIDGFTITGGNADSPDASETDPVNYGGGLFCLCSSLVVLNCKFESNISASGGGGLFVVGDVLMGPLRIENCIFQDNDSWLGGGVGLQSANTIFVENELQNNSASYYGGALSIHLGSDVFIEDCGFTDNTANAGGSISISGGYLQMRRSNVSGNTASGYGGGAMVLGNTSLVAIEDCEITDNSGLQYGGGFSLQNNAELTLRDTIVAGNSSQFGAGIFSYKSSIITNSVRFENNTAELGGAIYNNMSIGELVNTVFDSNAAVFEEDSTNEEEGTGGGIHSAGGAITCTNCTFSDNTATFGGSAVHSATYIDSHNNDAVVEDDTTVINSILWGNGKSQIGWNGVEPLVSYCDIAGGFAGDGNIDADPLFVNASGGDFHLTAMSPCIDAADPEAAPKTDFDNLPRGAQPDIGAYEFFE